MTGAGGGRDDGGARGVTDCRRTGGLRDRAVAGTLTPEDAVHAASCAECGPVLARAARFEDELRRAARGLITEELPRGILDPGLAPVNESSWQPRRAASGLATAVAAVVVLLLATVVALVPGAPPQPTEPAPSVLGSPAKSPGPPGFRPTSLIRANLAKIDYTCNDGQSLPSVGSGPDAVVREAAVCMAPGDIGPLIAAVIVGEASRGAVIEVVVKSDIMGVDTPGEPGAGRRRRSAGRWPSPPPTSSTAPSWARGS